MELKNGMFVKCPIDTGVFRTKKKYEVSNVSKSPEPFIYSFFIKDDKGRERYCLLNKCNHIGRLNWIIVDTKKDMTKSITWTVIAVVTIFFTAFIVSLFL